MAYQNVSAGQVRYNDFYQMGTGGAISRVIYDPEENKATVFVGGKIAADIPGGDSYDLEQDPKDSDQLKVTGENGKKGVIHISALETAVRHMPDHLKEPKEFLQNILKTAEPLMRNNSHVVL